MRSPLDDLDQAICALLMVDARRAVSDIAARVGMSSTAVKRRLDRLERDGIITGYSANVDLSKLGWTISAFVELRFAGKTTPDLMDRATSQIDELSAVYTTAGDQDVIALVRARDVDHLRDTIHRLRASTNITSTRTHLILQSRVENGGRLLMGGRPAPSAGP